MRVRGTRVSPAPRLRMSLGGIYSREVEPSPPSSLKLEILRADLNHFVPQTTAEVEVPDSSLPGSTRRSVWGVSEFHPAGEVGGDGGKIEGHTGDATGCDFLSA